MTPPPKGAHNDLSALLVVEAAIMMHRRGAITTKRAMEWIREAVK